MELFFIILTSTAPLVLALVRIAEALEGKNVKSRRRK